MKLLSKSKYLVIALLLVSLLVSIPAPVKAQQNVLRELTQNRLIALLQNLIAMLQARVDELSQQSSNDGNDQQQISNDTTITVTAPRGGETWYSNLSQIVTWSTTNIPSSNGMTLVLKRSNGTTYATLVSGTPNDGWQSVNLVSVPDGQYKMEITTTVDGQTVTDSGGLFNLATQVQNDTTPPPTPSLTAPGDNATPSSNYISFNWTDVSDPSGVKYDWQVAQNTNFSPTVGSVSNIADSAWATTVPGAGNFWWRVRARDGAGNLSGWTSARKYTIGQTQADLYISAPTTLTVSPTTVAAGQTVTMTTGWTIKNQGTAASEYISNGFYLSTDSTITSSDTYLTGNNNTALTPGDLFAWGGPTLTIPANTTAGTYYIGILVDRTNTTAESNESNNYKSTSLTVTGSGQADLYISAPTTLTVSPTTVAAGQTVTMTTGWTIKNQGTASTEGQFYLGRYLSIDVTITADDTLLASNTTTALEAGASRNAGALTFTIPANTPTGTRYVGILLDRNNAISESNESNNWKSARIMVTR